MEPTQTITAPKEAGPGPNGASATSTVAGPIERSRPPLMRLVLYVVLAVAVLAALVAGVRYLAYATAHETTDDAKIDADQVEITSKISERVATILVNTNDYVHKGQLLIRLDDRDERARLASAVATRDAYRAQGQAALATVALTRDQQNAQILQGRGAVEGARASVQSASEQARSAQEQIAVAESGVSDAQAQVRAAQAAVPGALENLRKAQADLARISALVGTGDVARSQLDATRAAERMAESGYQQAQANVEAARANLASAQEKVAAQQATTGSAQAVIGVNEGSLVNAEGKLAESSTPNRIAAQQATADAALAQVSTAQTQVKIAADNLSYTQIRSPIDGYVGQKSVEVGQTVSPGSSLLTIVPSNGVYVTANYKETQLGRIRKGQPVDIKVDAYRGVTFAGYVENISPASQSSFSLVPAQNASGNFVKVTQRVPVRIRFKDPDPNYPLRPGMSIETSVKVK
jgi:membrane fusion protein (multidrug efflux system)